MYKHKYDADGNFKKHEARLVANGTSQEHVVDFSKTFSHVVKSGTIRTILHVALAHQWFINQLDVQNGFSMEPWMRMSTCSNYLDLSIRKNLSSLQFKTLPLWLKRSSRAWNATIFNFITIHRLTQCKSCKPIWLHERGSSCLYQDVCQ